MIYTLCTICMICTLIIGDLKIPKSTATSFQRGIPFSIQTMEFNTFRISSRLYNFPC